MRINKVKPNATIPDKKGIKLFHINNNLLVKRFPVIVFCEVYYPKKQY